MGVATDHLGSGDAGNILDVERPFGIGAKVGVKQHLVQHIAQFFDHVVAVTRFDRVDEFVTFFDQVLEQRLVRLFAVPRATVGAAQCRHDLNQRVEFGVAGFAHDSSP